MATTEMATKHGNKVYVQLLLDPARALLLEQIAEDKGMKLSALARQAIYDWVGFMTEPEVFKAAEELDEARWRQSVQKRLEGRKRSREIRLILQEISCTWKNLTPS